MTLIKNQHYVPEFYLREWCIPNTEQVHVFDKEKKEEWITNIDNIASENYFYDFILKDYCSEEEIQALNDSGLATEGKLQIIEKMFSIKLEGPFSRIFADVIKNTRQSSPWKRKECYFITPERKEEIAAYLAFQYIRTRAVRDDLISSAERIVQLCRKKGMPEENVQKLVLTKKGANRIHNRMLLDKENIYKCACLFHRLTWILGINKTKQTFFTSDKPVCLFGHSDNNPSFIQGTGLASSGVEIAFPLAPDLMLIMMDGDYHKHVASEDRNYYEFEKPELVEYYNSLVAMQTNSRMIISCDGDFSLLEKLAKCDGQK